VTCFAVCCHRDLLRCLLSLLRCYATWTHVQPDACWLDIFIIIILVVVAVVIVVTNMVAIVGLDVITDRCHCC